MSTDITLAFYRNGIALTAGVRLALHNRREWESRAARGEPDVPLDRELREPGGGIPPTRTGYAAAGPWDMTATGHGSGTTLFVSMALNGGAKGRVRVVKNSTVVRITLSSGPGQAPKVLSQQAIANAIPWRDDPSALAIGPTGVALASNGTLYVADTLDNGFTAIPDAMTRTTPAPDAGPTVSVGGRLKQPLGLARAQRRHPDDQRR